MTTSDQTLRTLAGMAQGRNWVPQFACGFGHPDDDSGIDLQNTVLSVVEFVREPVFFANGTAFDFAAIESNTIDAVGNPYTLDLDGSPATVTVVTGDTGASVMDRMATEINDNHADYTATRLTYQLASATPAT